MTTLSRDSQFNSETSSSEWGKNRGRLRGAEFNWGNKDTVRLIGGINFETDNRIANYALGVMLHDDSQFLIRQFILKDQLFHKGGVLAPRHLLGNVDASATEISYIRKLWGAEELIITYGQSNLPTVNYVRKGGDISLFDGPNSGKDIFIDMEPKLSYLTAGFRTSGLKDMTLHGEYGWGMYADYGVGFGFMKQIVSRNLIDYTSGLYGRTDFSEFHSQTAYDGAFKLNLELGTAYVFKVAERRSAFSFGAFLDFAEPILSDLLSLNKTNSGNIYTVGGRSVYGVNANLGFQF